jgi:hypothetical protein
MGNATISGIKGANAKPDSLPAATKAKMAAGYPKRTAMSVTLPNGKNAMPKVK